MENICRGLTPRQPTFQRRKGALHCASPLFAIWRKENAMPIYKRCSRCGKRLPSGTSCPCLKKRYQEYDRYSRDRKSKEFYNGAAWIRTRAAVLQLDEGIDVYVYMTTGEILLADTVHHIRPLKDDWSRRLDIENLMSLNHDTHSMIEQKYKEDKAEIMEILQTMIVKYRKEER